MGVPQVTRVVDCFCLVFFLALSFVRVADGAGSEFVELGAIETTAVKAMRSIKDVLIAYRPTEICGFSLALDGIEYLLRLGREVYFNKRFPLWSYDSIILSPFMTKRRG